MENGGRTEKSLEMVSLKEGNHPVAADEIDWWVFQMDCLHSEHCGSIYLMIQHWHPGIAERQMGYPVEALFLLFVELCSSTCFVNKTWW